GALVLTLLLIATLIGKKTGTIWDVPLELTWVSIVSHALLLQDFYATGSINYVFWSIAVEWQIYFLFPLLVLGFRRLGSLQVVGLALLIGYALRIGFAHTRIARANPHFVGMFSLGMLAAYVAQADREPFKRWRYGFPWAAVGSVAFVTAVALAMYWGFRSAIHSFYWLDMPVGIFATCLLVLTSRLPQSRLRSVFAFKPLAFVGTFSYSVYLLHAPLLQLMWQYVLSPLGLAPEAMFSVLLSFGLLAVLGCAYLFFLVLEKPFMSSASGSGHAAGPPIPKAAS
ncbi:MAG TPA: acyltransferase, partial [Polyangiaceae bacterium]|nr:acyltransferase [Polyangiaceae bacterium]